MDSSQLHHTERERERERERDALKYRNKNRIHEVCETNEKMENENPDERNHLMKETKANTCLTFTYMLNCVVM